MASSKGIYSRPVQHHDLLHLDVVIEAHLDVVPAAATS
jgi:hypothetical protein